jgi:hypothetical protein
MSTVILMSPFSLHSHQYQAIFDAKFIFVPAPRCQATSARLDDKGFGPLIGSVAPTPVPNLSPSPQGASFRAGVRQ